MAKRTSTALARVIPMRAPTPIIRVSAPKEKKRVKHRKASSPLSQNTLMASVIGGAIMGFIDKSFPNFPTVPILGKAGTIAVVAYFFGKSGGGQMGGLARDVALASAAVAGYELGSTGKVTGEIMGGTVVPQISGGVRYGRPAVSGLAAQV